MYSYPLTPGLLALRTDTPSELITIDSNYRARVDYRRATIAANAATATGALPAGRPAVQELYAYLLADYLPARYPSMFALSGDRKTFRNLVTGRSFPASCPPPPPPSREVAGHSAESEELGDLLEAWRILGETVEEDLFLLEGTDEGHRLVAFVCCFPSGFDPSAKLGKVLKDIHEPVPAYDKIGPSMERFFAKLEVGKSVKRLNVSSLSLHLSLLALEWA